MVYRFEDMPHYVRFYNMYACINIRHAICSQKMKIIRLPNLAKCYHFVIILLSSRGLMFGVPIYMNPFSMRHTTVAKLSCWNLANVIILLSLLLITFQQENGSVGAFFQVFFGAQKSLFAPIQNMLPLCSRFFTIIT